MGDPPPRLFTFTRDDAELVCVLTMPEVPPKATEHHMLVHRAKQRWAKQLAWSVRAEHLAKPGEHRIVEIDLHRPGAAMDTDNLHARMKVPLDVLSRAVGRKRIGLGVLWDDDPYHLTLAPECVRDSRTFTEIRVYRRCNRPV